MPIRPVLSAGTLYKMTDGRYDYYILITAVDGETITYKRQAVDKGAPTPHVSTFNEVNERPMHIDEYHDRFAAYHIHVPEYGPDEWRNFRDNWTVHYIIGSLICEPIHRKYFEHAPMPEEGQVIRDYDGNPLGTVSEIDHETKTITIDTDTY